jgi:hypothetical protein
MHAPRPLGGNEKAFWRLSDASPLTCALIAHVRPGLDPARVEEALLHLQARHPLLRAQIELRDGQPWFVWPDKVPPIPLEQRPADRAAWAADVERELARPIPWDRAPLERAVLLDHGDGCTLVMLLHHAIGDGMSGLAALRDVLWDATTGRPRSTTVYARSVAAESALPSRARGLRGGLRRLGTLANLAADGFRHRDPLKCPVRRAAAPHERTYHVEPRVFDAAQTSAISDRARASGSTVQGAIGAAMLMGVARAAGVRDERAITFGSPINVRDRLEPSMGEQMGLYLAASHYRGPLGPRTRFWDLARAIRGRIAEDLDSGRAVDALPLIDLFTRSLGGDKVSAQEFGRKWAEANGTTGLTNIGKIDIDAPPGFTIERVHAVAFPSGLDVFNAVASAYAGSLCLAFNWPEPCFDRSGALALVDDIERTLRAAVAGDPTVG